MEMSNPLPIMDFSDNETGCCPRFHPELWDGQTFHFDTLKFIKASTKSFMYMPLNMSKVMTKTMNDINTAEAVAKDRYMILSKDVSKWSCDHYFLVDSEVPGYPTEDLSGRYFAKVYDGGFKEITSWIKTYQNETLSKGIQTEDMFMFYTTCPKCAAHYGHNYVVILGKVKN